MAKNLKRLCNALETRVTESATTSTNLSDIQVKQKCKKSKCETMNQETNEIISFHPTLSSYIYGNRLIDNFFDVPCKTLAQGLLGQILVRMLPDKSIMRCKIVETECYLGGEDKASHTFNGRVTERNKPMYMKPGTTYVYFTYGMYHCFNISSQGQLSKILLLINKWIKFDYVLRSYPVSSLLWTVHQNSISIYNEIGDGAAVLIRAAEPIEGLEIMHLHRKAHQKKETLKMLKPHELCNGPSKLCMSLAIERFSCNKQDLSRWSGMWIEKATESKDRPLVVSSSRIGIDRVGVEWAQKPLRFYLLGNSSVSKRDKINENRLSESMH